MTSIFSARHVRMPSALLALVLMLCPGLFLQAQPPRPPIDASTALQSYLDNGDAGYAWEPRDTFSIGDVTVHSILLTSQTWRGMPWRHQLSIAVPRDLRHDAALLFINGSGMDKDGNPKWSGKGDKLGASIAMIAGRNHAVTAVLKQVPVQPLYGGLTEDALISHTLDAFRKDRDYTWPLLFPMVKSARRAMDCVQEFMSKHTGRTIGRFVVSGASKRGWTTWLWAAHDDRVVAFAPMVIDMLSLGDHVKLQLASFGRMSEELGDYTSRGIEKLLATPRGRELVQIVDPFSYRERYTMPKVIALGTNDPYWPLEACNLYYDRLPGPRWVSYAPNAGHGLPLTRVAALVAAVGRHVAGIEPLPPVEWSFADDGRGGAECVVRCDAKPERVVLWTASAGTRDFRDARWSAEPVAAAGPEWRVPLPAPKKGFAAGLVELEFAREPVPLMLTSGVKVLSSRG